MNPELEKDVSDLIARWRDQPNTTLEEIIDAFEDAIEDLAEEVNERG